MAEEGPDVPEVPPAFLEGLSQLQIELEEGELDRLGRFLDLLFEANAVMNLTGIRERDIAWNRHVLDSLTLVPLIEASDAKRVLDLGSGGGSTKSSTLILLSSQKL